MGGRIGREEGRKESKNLCFILGSHTPESLFTLYLLTCALFVLHMCYGRATLSSCFCWKRSFAPLSPTPLPHSVCPCFQVHELLRRPRPSINGLFTKPNQLTYLAETFFCWVSELNWCRGSSDRQGREKERVEACSKKGGKHWRTKSFLV